LIVVAAIAIHGFCNDRFADRRRLLNLILVYRPLKDIPRLDAPGLPEDVNAKDSDWFNVVLCVRPAVSERNVTGIGAFKSTATYKPKIGRKMIMRQSYAKSETRKRSYRVPSSDF
jgi:hypothetical protein